MIYSGNTITDLPSRSHEAVAGFFNTPFEGGNKSGNVTRWWLSF
jgi:hypothetical protein